MHAIAPRNGRNPYIVSDMYYLNYFCYLWCRDVYVLDALCILYV